MLDLQLMYVMVRAERNEFDFCGNVVGETGGRARDDVTAFCCGRLSD
jgi:hypothetical protein